MAGKANSSRNAYKGAVRPTRRAIVRECKAAMAALLYCEEWLAMEERIDTWLSEREARHASSPPSNAEFIAAGLKDLPPPKSPLVQADFDAVLGPAAAPQHGAPEARWLHDGAGSSGRPSGDDHEAGGRPTSDAGAPQDGDKGASGVTGTEVA